MAERVEGKGDVLDLLNKAALATAQATLTDLESESLKQVDQEYFLTDATLIERSGLSFSRKKVIRKAWDVYAANRILEKIKKEFSADLEACAQQLAGRKDLPTVRGDLGLFLLAIVKRTADEASVECVPEMVGRLLFEYEGGELCWTGNIWLSGIRVDEPVQIEPGFILRPPVSEDFFSERLGDAVGFGMEFQSPFNIPDSVLDLTCKDRSRPNFRREVNALCLFRLGAVEMLQEDWRSNSVLPYMGDRWMPLRPNPHTSFTYKLSQADAPSLAEFLKSVVGELPIKPLGHHEEPRWIGLKNYFRALHTASDVEERLGQAVASLEASLLAGEKGELRYRLSLRTASLLRHAGVNPNNVFTETRTAYDFRSSYAHGGEIGSKDLKRANELCPRIMDYARLAVVKFLEFPHKQERRKLLEQLDLALLDEGERRKLEAKLSGGLWRHAIE